MVHLGIAAALLAGPTILPAQSLIPVQSVCAERTALLSSLRREYSEAPTALGLASNGSVLELLTTSDGKTWTILMTRPDGTSCVLAAGEAWESLPQVARGEPL
ncbi:MAG: hypothetical protein AB1918_12170 [Pseudomonadota bacterium]